MRRRFKNVIVELRPSKIDPKGVGVFAITNIKQGTKIFDGIYLEDFNNLISWKIVKNLPEMTLQKINAFCVGTPKGFFPPENFDFNNLSIEWYLNHSCDGNIGFNKDGDFIAIKEIKPNDELSYDYGLVESNPKFKMLCNCGSYNCRKKITGNDWIKLLDDPEKKKFMHLYLRSKI
jgi:SET domain-containing protein